MVRKQILKKLQVAFKPKYLDIIDESYKHNIQVNSKIHLKVILVSDHFIGKQLLMRHRVIYEILSEELIVSVYALALYIFTLKEWEKQQNRILSSPCCLRTIACS